MSAENSWTQGSREETRAQPEEEAGPRCSVPRRAGCHPGRRWAVLQPQTEMRSGGCSLGRIWDLLWALLNARALWAGLGCQNYEPSWAEPWESPASSQGPKQGRRGPKQGLRKSLRGLHPAASKHEKPLLNVCIYACMCVHRCVSVCTGVCVCLCVHARAHPHRHHRLLRVPQPRLRKGHAQAWSTQLRSTTQSRSRLLAPAQGSSHQPGTQTLICTARSSLPTG